MIWMKSNYFVALFQCQLIFFSNGIASAFLALLDHYNDGRFFKAVQHLSEPRFEYFRINLVVVIRRIKKLHFYMNIVNSEEVFELM